MPRPPSPAPAPPSFPASWPLRALDRMWARPAGLLKEVWAVRTPQARAASDHLPVVGRVVPDGE